MKKINSNIISLGLIVFAFLYYITLLLTNTIFITSAFIMGFHVESPIVLLCFSLYIFNYYLTYIFRDLTNNNFLAVFNFMNFIIFIVVLIALFPRTDIVF